MKLGIKTLGAYLVLICATLASVTAQDSPIGLAIGQAFVGAMSATQSNMTNTESDCYTAATYVADEVLALFNSFDPATAIDKF